MPSWDDLLGEGSVANQLLVWGVANQLLGAILGAPIDIVAQEVNAKAQQTPLSPADLADMVARGIRQHDDAAGEATLSGLSGSRFQNLVDSAGEPPGLQDVLEAWRRGIISWDGEGPGETTVANAIATSRTYTYWAPVIEKLATHPISTADAVNAYIRSQISLADAQAAAYADGTSQDDFAVLASSAGQPPSPTELIELYRRGLIPLRGTGPEAVSVEQGIAEGDTKNKWFDQYAALATYLPPPRIVTTLLRSGAITSEQAATFFQRAGLSQDLSAAYVKSVAGERMEGTRQLQQGVILDLFEGGAIDTEAATTMLGALGYTAAQAAFLLEVYELKRETAALNRAVGRVGTLYTSGRITRSAATEALGELGVTGAHAATLMKTWDISRVAEVKLPNISDIGKAVKYGAITPEEALTEAAKLGYQPFDAYVALSAAAETPVGVKPAIGPTGPGVI